VARPVSSRRAARSTEPPIAWNSGVLGHLHPCVSEHQRTPALQGAPSLPIRAPRLAVPTAQARMTRARGLHATRSSIRPNNDTNSLPEGRIERRFFLFRWHRAHTCHMLNVSPYSDLYRPMAWFPGAYDLRVLSWAHVRVWGAAGGGCHTPASPGSARFARSSYVNRALFGISTSAVACGSCQRLPRRAHVPMIGRAGHTRLGTRPSVGGGRCPEI